MDLAAWLEGLGLGRYAPLFRDHDIDAETLPELTASDLEQLGLSLGHRKRLLKALAGLRDRAREAPPSTGAAAVAIGPPEAERRQATILFADLAGFTRLAAELDAEEVLALLDQYFALVDAIVVQHGGRIDKHIGDCVMALFGAPVAHTDDPERAVRAALAIRDALPGLRERAGRELGVHIGIACGEVVAGRTGSTSYREYTVTGEAGNLAARLADRARTGEILVSDAVRSIVGERLEAEVSREITIDGFASPTRALSITGLRPLENEVPCRALVGRRHELARLLSLLEACRSGPSGRVVLVRGEPGIGKTRLIEEAIATARAQGAAAHRALVLDFGAGLGRNAIRAMLASLLGVALNADAKERAAAGARALTAGLVDAPDAVHLHDLLDLAPPVELRAVYDAMDHAAREDGRARMLAALVRRLARDACRLLVVEDVHWADAATLAQLAVLAGSIGDCPVLLVLTSRIEGDPLGVGWRASASNPPIVTIDLAPLHRDDALALAATLSDPEDPFTLRCVERAGGNPLFLEQLLRAGEQGSDALPGSIQSVVLTRMDMLAPRDRGALQAASVLGQRFELAALRAVVGDEAYACEELTGACCCGRTALRSCSCMR